MNQPIDLEDLNRRLTTLAAQHWFTATVHRDSPNDPSALFEAVTWRGGNPLHYTLAYRVSEIERLGPVAVANEFVEKARLGLPRGTLGP